MLLQSLLNSLFIGTCTRCGAECRTDTCPSCSNTPPRQFYTELPLSVLALGLYEDAPGSEVRALKYHESTVFASHLGWALARIVPDKWRHAVLVPVPLHPNKLAERGYNQSALIARALGKKSNMLVHWNLLERSHETGSQARLKRRARKKNMANAFKARTHKRALPIVLVDDVVTTGSTVDECALALRKENHQVLGVLTCALAR